MTILKFEDLIVDASLSGMCFVCFNKRTRHRDEHSDNSPGARICSQKCLDRWNANKDATTDSVEIQTVAAPIQKAVQEVPGIQKDPFTIDVNLFAF